MPTPELPILPAEALWAALDAARTGDPDILLVCAGERIAQAFLDDDLARQQAIGRRAWRSAPIVPVDRFLREAYERASLAAAVGRMLPAVLEPSQERALWRSIVEDAVHTRLLRNGEAARLAAGAWRLARDWQLPLPLPEARGNADVEQFNQWAARFHHRLEDLQAIDAAGLPAALAREQLAQFPPTLVFAGFDEFTPALADLLETLTRRGTRILATGAAPHAARVHRTATADAERELRAAAAWARKTLEAGALRIGIVVPNLSARRAALQRVFAETLPAHAFSIALGEPLAEFSIVQCALRLLSLQAGELALDELTSLLLSPYWDGDDAQRMARARVDLRLREDGFLRANLATLAATAERLEEPAFTSTCRRLLMLRAGRERLAPAAWAQRFANWLDAAGWPGTRAPDVREQEIRHRWNEVLGEFGTLGAVLPALSLSAALSHVREVAERTLFRSRTPAPVQVLAPRDSAGLQFDRLWVMGLDDQHWPPPARPNPLIPFSLQRERGLPHASAARELADATRLTALWIKAADEVVFSHALHEEDRELQGSPLIPDAPLMKIEIPERPQLWTRIFESRRLETLHDIAGLPPAAGALLRGGTRLFTDQSACPFRAYARHRLGAESPPEPVFGIDGRDRGILVHEALHHLWQMLRTQSALLALSNSEQAAHVGDAVDRAVNALVRKAPQRLGPAMAELERTRLVALLNQWLEIERARPPFEVAEIEGRAPGSRDAPRVSDVQGVAVRMRPDRVDRLPDGGALVLDYKTGDASGTPWNDERPDEPQLLLYGLDRTDTVGVAFAQVRTGETSLRGIAAEDGVAEGIDVFTQSHNLAALPSWNAVLDEWRRQIALLGEEIRAGFAGVLPKTPQVCERCNLQAFCRVRESRADIAGEVTDTP